MPQYVAGLLASFCLFSAGLSAEVVKGTVLDPSGAPVPGAQVSVTTRLGVEAQTVSAANGAFALDTAQAPDSRLVVTAPGFNTLTQPLAPVMTVQLKIAPQVDSVRVLGSAIDVSASEQGSSVSIIQGKEIRQRNEPLAVDLMRYIPGLAFAQTGPTGGVAGLYVRGGNSGFTLVQIDGVPVNTFGGSFDFAHIPAEELERVEVVRGPQSAVYGPYANSGVVNFVTRQPGSTPNLDIVTEGGSHNERRFGISGGGTLAGFGIAASASRMDTDGPVANSDYRNENLMLHVARRFGRQSLAFHGAFDSSENGVPGPWGSDPMHTFTGIDTVSRNRNNFSHYMAHYEVDLSSRVRQEVFGTFFLNNNGFVSPYGFSYNKDLRGQGETRTVVSFTPHYVAAFGVSEGLEEVKNTYVTDANYSTFPIRRNDTAVYFENRFEVGGRLFINAGARAEFIRTGAIPTDGYTRPYFPAQTVSTANPKVAAAYVWGRTRFHSSFGTGLRPPGAFDLAYTDNPSLKPERTRSVDAGVEQKLWGDRLAVDATYFYNRFHDLIVILGGSLANLSHFESANLANSRAQGAEFSGTLRPTRSVFVRGSYTWLDSEILSLNGTADAAPTSFAVGQELIRRPAHSGTLVASFTHGKLAADVTGYFRGSVLDVEPGWGASNGLFQNPGYANVGLNLNYTLAHGLTAYTHVRNALNRHYEEVFGYPSPLVNFVTGVKWTFSGGK